MTTMQAVHPDIAGTPANILVMEDEKIVAQGLEMVLAEEGYDVELAYTGADALKSMSAKSVDLLIADLRLPDIDGMEVIKTVKARKPTTEVIVITGYSSVTSAVDAMKLGVFDYLAKPFTESEIKEAVDGALKRLQEAGASRIEDRINAEEDKLIQKREVIRVLNRTADDNDFWKDLMENGSAALKNYRLSQEAKAAVAAGDLAWINNNIGELTQKQLMFVYSRLEREAW
ncbi:MAG: response regulator [Desulfofustis sp.]|nr:response regulator [Desulfofustis sp.]